MDKSPNSIQNQAREAAVDKANVFMGIGYLSYLFSFSRSDHPDKQS